MWIEILIPIAVMLLSIQSYLQSLQINKLTKRIAKLEGSK